MFWGYDLAGDLWLKIYGSSLNYDECMIEVWLKGYACKIQVCANNEGVRLASVIYRVWLHWIDWKSHKISFKVFWPFICSTKSITVIPHFYGYFTLSY